MKISEKAKKIIHIIIEVGKWLGLFLLGFFGVKMIAQIGSPKEYKTWEPLKGHKDKIIIHKENGENKIVKLPKDPETNKKIKNNEIVAAGIGKGGEAYVKKRSSNSDNSVN